MTAVLSETLATNIPTCFAAVAAAHHDRPAVLADGRQLSYSQLNAAANRLAGVMLSTTWEMSARHEATDAPVAVLAGHNADLITAILGVLKTGRGYSAFQPDRPPSQLVTLLDFLQAEIIICDAQHLALAQALAATARNQDGERQTDIRVLCIPGDTDGLAESDPVVTIAPSSLAVVCFTSGSTGEPKGVMRTHNNLLHRHELDQQLKQVNSDDRIALTFSASFGASQADLFGALLSGAALCLYDMRQQGLAPLADWINTMRLTRLHLPVESFRQWLETLPAAAFFPTLREIAPAGRMFRRDIEKARIHFAPGCQVVTRLASGETGLVAQMALDVHAPIEDEVIPVGRVAPGVEIAFLGEAQSGWSKMVQPPAEIRWDGADDVSGEIVVSSRFLAKGYWRRPDLTAAVFEDDPERPGWRRYRMGDWVRMRADGVLEFIGRRDERVKVRGYTVELGAVQAALAALAGVRNCAVIAQDTADGGKRIVAFVVAQDATGSTLPEPLSPASLRQALAHTLPDHMIPAAFVSLDALPLTANNKIDRGALLALAPSPTQRPDLPYDYVAPRTPTEAQMAGIWADVLGIDAIGVHDNFLDLGGNSILAARIVARVLHDLPVQSITLATLLQAPTIAEMAAILPPRLAEAEQLAALLAEMEALADDEAVALLGSV